ncbi:glycosyltransferase [Romboutsia sp.]|uniref:glycosyltransferase n=1 Tax=Romboutsia sp. TaxID=1965302 RepID=UPI003F2B45E0
MKILYIVNMNENNKKGLFTASHERLKELIKSKEIEDYSIYSIMFYDAGLTKLLKRVMKKPIRTKGAEQFKYDGLTYKKVYIKVGMINKILEKLNMDKSNYSTFLKGYEKEIKQCDLVSTHWGYPHGRIAYYIKQVYNKPYMVTYHGSDVHTMPVKNEHIKTKVLEVMNNATKNLFVSNKLYQAAKRLGYNKDNYIITKNGVNTEKFYKISDDKIKELKQKLKLTDKVVGFVGNLNNLKRADKLIEIFENIKNNSKEEVSFLVVGDGPLKGAMTQQGIEKNLNLHFTGNVNVDEVREYMNVMDVMVTPSRKEGFGCVIIEANACGTMVVASNVGGICEAIQNQELMVEEGDNFEIRFANKVCEILASDYDKYKLIKQVKDNFTWNSAAKDEMKLYGGSYE